MTSFIRSSPGPWLNGVRVGFTVKNEKDKMSRDKTHIGRPQGASVDLRIVQLQS
jgi:hypothetical protein